MAATDRTLPAQKLTDKYVRNLKPLSGVRLVVPDASLKGFAFRLTEREDRSFTYRFGGEQRRAVWRYVPDDPVLSLAAARDGAGEIVQAIAKGTDPKTLRAAPKTPAADDRTFSAALGKYFTDPLVVFDRKTGERRATMSERKKMIERDVSPALGRRPMAEITKRDCRDILEAVHGRACKLAEKRERLRAKVARREPDPDRWAKAGATSNRLRAYLHHFFAWAIRKDYIKENPVSGIERLAPEISRDRVLTDGEIRSVWKACDELNHPQAEAVKFLLLSGQRLGQVQEMRWPEIESEPGKIGTEWALRRGRTKNKEAQLLPLVEDMRTLLGARPRIEGCEWVFTVSGKNPPGSFDPIKKKIDELSGVADWILHDCRRTLASGMAKLRIAPHVIEAVLNHKTGVISGVAAIYNRYLYLDEQRHALEAWCAYVRRVLDPPADNVEELAARAGAAA